MTPDYSLLLEESLNSHINLEKSRSFDSKKLLSSQKKLEGILGHEAFGLEESRRRISIVGSNGKGSTAFYLAGLCSLQKEKIGLFTSPHLLYLEERIRLRTQRESLAQAVDPRLAWEALQEIKEILEKSKEGRENYKSLSYFEVLTILAAYIFHKENCVLEIFEAGLGGRFDATRALKAEHVILTVIEKEHTEILGRDPKDILQEKLGILHKRSTSLFCMPQSRLKKEDIESTARSFAPKVKCFFYEEEYENKEAKEKTNYLEKNKNFASFVLENLGLPCQKEGDIKIPGRLEKHNFFFPEGTKKELIFDVAHNPPGILRSLRDLSSQADPAYRQRSLLLLAVLRGRSFRDMLSAAQEAGFFRIKQLLNEDWAPSERGVEGLDLRDIHPQSPKLGKILQKEFSLGEEQNERALERIIFLGTHYSYSYFVGTLDFFRKRQS